MTTTDPDAGDTFAYTVTNQTVANAFEIRGDKLQVGSGDIDFEATPNINVTVRSTDSGGDSVVQAFTVWVTDVNEAPTAISVSNVAVVKGSRQGTDVATLSTTDPDDGDTFTYSVQAQSSRNAFKISGDKLQVGSGGNALATDSVVSVTLRTTDSGGLSYERTVDITVTKAAGANLVVLGVVAAGLFVVAGAAFAMYSRGGHSAGILPK